MLLHAHCFNNFKAEGLCPFFVWLLFRDTGDLVGGSVTLEETACINML